MDSRPSEREEEYTKSERKKKHKTRSDCESPSLGPVKNNGNQIEKKLERVNEITQSRHRVLRWRTGDFGRRKRTQDEGNDLIIMVEIVFSVQPHLRANKSLLVDIIVVFTPFSSV